MVKKPDKQPIIRLSRLALIYGTTVYKALSDTARVRILHLIAINAEMCTADLEWVLDFTQTKVSRHLTYLKNAGLVSGMQKDKWLFYSINAEIADVTATLLKLFDKDATLANDAEVYRIMLSNRELAANKVAFKTANNHFGHNGNIK